MNENFEKETAETNVPETSAEAIEPANAAFESTEEIKPVVPKKKKSKKKIIIPIVIIIVILIVLGLKHVLFSGTTEETGAAQSAQAYTGDITSTVTGSGTLSAASTSNITIPTGVVIDTVLVRNGETVTAGQKLASVDVASAAQALLTVRENIQTVTKLKQNLGNATDTTSDNYLRSIVYQDTLDQLNSLKATLETMVSTGYLTSDRDGIISAVNVTDGGTAGSQTSAESSTQSGTGTVTYQSGQVESGNDYISLLADDVNVSEITIKDIAPVTGEIPVTTIDTDAYSGIISWDPQTNKFEGSTGYTATIVLSPKDGVTFDEALETEEDALEIEGAEDVAVKLGSIGDTPAVLIVAKFPATAADPTKPTEEETTANASETEPAAADIIEEQAAAAGMADTDLSAFVSGGSGDSDSGSAATEYTVATTAAFTIASNEEITINITINELDILSVEQGQTATVTVDAIEGQEFTGTLTKITSSSSSTDSNGNVSYTAEITIDKTDDMRVGMSASATVETGQASDALLIPAGAVQEDGEMSYVYTGVDSDGNPTDEVEVETGVSNADEVQILSGLSEGDTVYYTQTTSDSEEDYYFY